MATLSLDTKAEVMEFLRSCQLYFFNDSASEDGLLSLDATDTYPQSRICTPVNSPDNAASDVRIRGQHVWGVRPGENSRPICSVRPRNAQFMATLWRPNLHLDVKTDPQNGDYVITDMLSGENSRLRISGNTITVSPAADIAPYPGATSLQLCTTASLWYCAMNRVYHYRSIPPSEMGNSELGTTLIIPGGAITDISAAGVGHTAPWSETGGITGGVLPFTQDVDEDEFNAYREALPTPPPMGPGDLIAISTRDRKKGENAKSTAPNVLLPLVRQLTVGTVGSGADVEIAGQQVIKFTLSLG